VRVIPFKTKSIGLIAHCQVIEHSKISTPLEPSRERSLEPQPLLTTALAVVLNFGVSLAQCLIADGMVGERTTGKSMPVLKLMGYCFALAYFSVSSGTYWFTYCALTLRC
jgi:hypothetical protein